MLPRAATTPVGLPAALGPAALSVAGLGDSAPQTRGSMHCGTQRYAGLPESLGVSCSPFFCFGSDRRQARRVLFLRSRLCVQLNDTEVRIT